VPRAQQKPQPQPEPQLYHRARLSDASLKRQRREWLAFAGASGLCRTIALGHIAVVNKPSGEVLTLAEAATYLRLPETDSGTP
jgi:hypothetical protein